MKRLALCMSSLLLLAHLSGCGPVDATAPTKVATATQGALSAELQAKGGEVSAGLSSLWLKLTDGNAQVTDATLTLMPLMTMENGMKHSCPLPAAPSHQGDGLYLGQAVFQMAGDWALDVKVERPGHDAVTLSFTLPVKEGPAKVFMVEQGASMGKYVLSFGTAETPKVGANTAVVTLHRMKDMMTFLPFDDATLTMVPEMPAMGHGSSGNVAPTRVSPGRYEGVINFSMKGEWKTTLTVQAGDATLTEASFDTSL